MEAALFRIYTKFEDAFGKEKAREMVEDMAILIDHRSENLLTKEDFSNYTAESGKEHRERELRLTLEIEGVKKDIVLIRKEIESIKSDIVHTHKEIEELKKDTADIRRDIKDLEVRLVREINSAKIWMITSVGIIIAAIKALDYILK